MVWRFGICIALAALLISPKLEASSATRYLAKAALEYREWDIAVELYEQLHQQGDIEATFILSRIARHGPTRHESHSRTKNYRDMAAAGGHQYAIAEQCADAGHRATETGNYLGLANLCAQAARMTRPLEGFAPFEYAFPDKVLFQIPFYYIARDWEQRGEIGLSVLCYFQSFRLLYPHAEDIERSPHLRVAYQHTQRRLVAALGELALKNDPLLRGSVDIYDNPFRIYEPCGVSAIRVEVEIMKWYVAQILR